MSWLTSSMPNDSMHMLTHRLLYTILNLYLCIWIPLLSDLQTMNQTYIFPLYNSHTLFTHVRDGACFVLCIYVFCYHLFILCRCSMYHCFDWQPQDCASQGQRVATIREEMIKNLRYAALNILCACYWIYMCCTFSSEFTGFVRLTPCLLPALQRRGTQSDFMGWPWYTF